MNERIPRRLAAAAVLAVPVAVAVAVVALGSGGGAAPSGADRDGAAGPSASPTVRTVLVSSERMPPPSEPGSVLRALRLSGRVPTRPTSGTVLTDEDCAADARGISRCVNRVRVASGRTLTLRHPHRMMEVPCLSPGEPVSVRAA